MSRRRAFTLVEVTVMGAVAIMLLGIFYSLFVSSSMDSQKLSRKLQSIQAAHLLLERLEDDLKQAVYVRGTFDMQVFNHGTGSANAVVFYRVDPRVASPADGGTSVKVERVEYVWDPLSCKVVVNGKAFAGGLFKRLEFRYTEGTPAAEPPVYADYLTVTVTGIPDEDAKRKIEDIDLRELTTLVASFSFRARAMARAYEPWTPVAGLVGSH
jgi:hypothetical protein